MAAATCTQLPPPPHSIHPKLRMIHLYYIYMYLFACIYAECKVIWKSTHTHTTTTTTTTHALTDTNSFREANTPHITYKDGLQLIHFPNNQMERHYPDGSREVPPILGFLFSFVLSFCTLNSLPQCVCGYTALAQCQPLQFVNGCVLCVWM